jgi:serum/glucocorticoid-regulated kinase 2
LGCNGIQEIKEHPWFAEFDWAGLAAKRLVSPYKPTADENFETKHRYDQDPWKDANSAALIENKKLLKQASV